MNKPFFFFGLFIFYIIIFFAPNKSVYFAAYLFVTFFFYRATGNIHHSLLYGLILSFFSDIGLGGRLFLMEPEDLGLGSGYWISPLTIFSILLTLAVWKENVKAALLPSDVLVFDFVAWSFVGVFFFPYPNVVYGIVSLGELVIVYFLLRLTITGKTLFPISWIFVSMILFQSAVGIGQLVLHRPIGSVSESSIFNNPRGLTTIENRNLFRITGTFGHPNNTAAFILAILPLAFVSDKKTRLFTLAGFLGFIVLFFTYSRVAWGVGALSLMWYRKRMFKTMQRRTVFLTIVCILILAPLFFLRLQSIPTAFVTKGSYATRIKLAKEGWNLIRAYPVTGIGLNQSLETYAKNPVTDVFNTTPPGKFYSIHNTLLEIATETGIVGVCFFLAYLIFTARHYFRLNKKSPVQHAAFVGFLCFFLISLFNPFFHSSSFRLFFLLSAILLVGRAPKSRVLKLE